ncbi:Alpha/Beta hydrolase protein [Xylariomycetidae sp. FL2044]|nr:Alpha/Beta hydrolase protein [Xylariomycetidae sp. FL2044]
MSATEDRPVYQPIHPDVRPLLDPEYAAFHDRYFQYVQPDDQKPWDGSARTRPSWLPDTESASATVGSVRDIDLENFPVRIFTPEGPRPDAGWPVLLWFHGGGWAVGGVGMTKDLLSLICHRARAIVVTVGYRLAPEHPFPAAIDDAVEALRWVHGEEGSRRLGGVDRSRVAIGGTSAGGHLSAVLAMRAAQMEPPIDIAFQLLVVPVIDNHATVETVWAANKNAPWLTPARMTWYRRMWLANREEVERRPSWEVSPNLAPPELLARTPKTWIAVAEQDLLSPEAKLYASQLDQAWKKLSSIEGDASASRSVEVKVYGGSTHSILSMSGVLTKGRQLVEDTAELAARWYENE